MSAIRASPHRSLTALVVILGGASLLHFIHNAEFLGDYPNMPASWSRLSVYVAWAWMTALGLAGWLLVRRGAPGFGLPLLAVYSLLGLVSLGHYVLAPMPAHTMVMNATILLEVAAAAALLIEVLRRGALQALRKDSQT